MPTLKKYKGGANTKGTVKTGRGQPTSSTRTQPPVKGIVKGAPVTVLTQTSPPVAGSEEPFQVAEPPLPEAPLKTGASASASAPEAGAQTPPQVATIKGGPAAASAPEAASAPPLVAAASAPEAAAQTSPSLSNLANASPHIFQQSQVAQTFSQLSKIDIDVIVDLQPMNNLTVINKQLQNGDIRKKIYTLNLTYNVLTSYLNTLMYYFINVYKIADDQLIKSNIKILKENIIGLIKNINTAKEVLNYILTRQPLNEEVLHAIQPSIIQNIRHMLEASKQLNTSLNKPVVQFDIKDFIISNHIDNPQFLSIEYLNITLDIIEQYIITNIEEISQINIEALHPFSLHIIYYTYQILISIYNPDLDDLTKMSIRNTILTCEEMFGKLKNTLSIHSVQEVPLGGGGGGAVPAAPGGGSQPFAEGDDY